MIVDCCARSNAGSHSNQRSHYSQLITNCRTPVQTVCFDSFRGHNQYQVDQVFDPRVLLVRRKGVGMQLLREVLRNGIDRKRTGAIPAKVRKSEPIRRSGSSSSTSPLERSI